MMHFPGKEVECIANLPASAGGMRDSGRDSSFALSLRRFQAKLSVTNVLPYVATTLHI